MLELIRQPLINQPTQQTLTNTKMSFSYQTLTEQIIDKIVASYQLDCQAWRREQFKLYKRGVGHLGLDVGGSYFMDVDNDVIIYPYMMSSYGITSRKVGVSDQLWSFSLKGVVYMFIFGVYGSTYDDENGFINKLVKVEYAPVGFGINEGVVIDGAVKGELKRCLEAKFKADDEEENKWIMSLPKSKLKFFKKGTDMPFEVKTQLSFDESLAAL